AVLTFVMTTFVGTGAALSATAVAANEDWFPARSRMPFAFVASATVNEPDAVFTVPSFSVSVAIVVATDTLASVFDAPPGALASVQGVVPAEYVSRVSPNVAFTWSTLPSASVSNIWSVDNAGAVLSIVTLPDWFVVEPRLSLALVVKLFEPAESGLLEVSAALRYAYAVPLIVHGQPLVVSATAVWPTVTFATFAVMLDAFTPEEAPAPAGRSVTFAYTRYPPFCASQPASFVVVLAMIVATV